MQLINENFDVLDTWLPNKLWTKQHTEVFIVCWLMFSSNSSRHIKILLKIWLIISDEQMMSRDTPKKTSCQLKNFIECIYILPFSQFTRLFLWHAATRLSIINSIQHIVEHTKVATRQNNMQAEVIDCIVQCFLIWQYMGQEILTEQVMVASNELSHLVGSYFLEVSIDKIVKLLGFLTFSFSITFWN